VSRALCFLLFAWQTLAPVALSIARTVWDTLKYPAGGAVIVLALIYLVVHPMTLIYLAGALCVVAFCALVYDLWGDFNDRLNHALFSELLAGHWERT
jgi:hypothetical protein